MQVKSEYLPILSAALLTDGIIDQPIHSVIRKGKSHYVCPKHLERRLGQLDLSKKNWRAGAALLSLREQLDMDGTAHLISFIRAVAVPEMQIKLKQGFGRAIRTETDTCVIAVLDERAAPGQRHYEAMRAALPEMPVTNSLEGVVEFIYRVKGPEYFRERENNYES